MNSLDLLSLLAPFRDWTPAEILASPAWALTCHLGSDEGRIVSEGALRPVDPLRLAVRFADEPATLELADSPLFPELHALWPSRADVPDPVLLALVEKECGPLLQLIENAAGRQLAIDGLADVASPAGEGDQGSSPKVADPGLRPATCDVRPFSLRRASGEELCSFALTLSPALVEAFGALRSVNPAHDSIRQVEYSAKVQLAAPILSSEDLASLAPGDHILLPEVKAPAAGQAGSESEPSSEGLLTCPEAVVIVEGRLAASASSGLAPWSDPGTLRVVLRDPVSATFGDLSDLAAGEAGDNSAFIARNSTLKAGAALALLRGPAILATGSLGFVAGQPSFEIETVTPQS